MFSILLFLVLLQSTHCKELNEFGIQISRSNWLDFEFLNNFTRTIYKFYPFENFVIHISSKSNHGEEFLAESLSKEFSTPIIITNDQYSGRFRHFIGVKTLLLVVFANLDDPLLNAADESVKKKHLFATILIRKSNWTSSLSKDEIKKLFEWCWKRHIVSVVLIQQIENRSLYNGTGVPVVENQVYQYTPFPRVTVMNVTGLDIQKQANFFKRMINNVRGYTFKTPVYKMEPYIFISTDKSCLGKSVCPDIIAGSGGRFYTEFIKSINGKIEIIPRNVSFFNAHNETLECVKNKTIHIGALVTSDLYHSNAIEYGSAPLWHVNSCIMAPFNPEIFYGNYVLNAFEPTVWLMVFVVIILLMMLQTLSNFWTSLRKKFVLSENIILYAFGRLLNQPMLPAALRLHGLLYRIWQMLILLMCYLLVNIYTGTLTSLFSTTVLDKQIQSVEDFHDSGVTLLLSPDQKRTLFDNGRLPKELLQHSQILDTNALNQQRKQMNSSYAFVTNSDLWSLLSITQQRLWKPTYRICYENLCTNTFFIKFPIRRDSPFFYSLMHFSLRVQRAGLFEKWISMSTMQILKGNNFKKLEDDTDHLKPLGIQHYIYVIWFCFGMWIAASLAFYCEMLIFRWRN